MVQHTKVDMNSNTGARSLEQVATELNHTRFEFAETFGANLSIDINPSWNLEPRILCLGQKLPRVFGFECSISICCTGRRWWWNTGFRARADIGGKLARNSRA
eukprot:COSAG02_NODE_3652_length_6414_cov_10.240222_7_plen_103_part_00